MEFCERYRFDPECTVVIKGVRADVCLENVREEFALVDEVVQIQSLDDHTLLCQFAETITPMLVEGKHSSKDGSCWEVILVDEYYAESIDEAPHKYKMVPLARVMGDLTVTFKEQISELAIAYNVNPTNLSQSAASYICEKVQRNKGPVTSTPAHQLKPTASSDSLAESANSAAHISGQTQSPKGDSSLVITVPADVQRVVVEHIVKHDSPYTSTVKEQRPFSGNVPKPPSEVDYNVWRLRAKQALNDITLSEGQQRRVILDSLLTPALNVALDIGLQATPRAYLQELDSAYGNVTGGEELYIQFLETHQNDGERASEYLRRLQTLLQEVRERNGVSKDDETQLLKQFLRGCWDDSLITTLHLKELLSNPSKMTPTFSELLLKIRTYEKESQLKEVRRKKHMGVASTKVHTKALVTIDEPQAACSNVSNIPDAATREQLEERIRQLEAELKKSMQRPRNFKDGQKFSSRSRNTNTTSPDPELPAEQQTKFRRFCYKCGEDSHILPQCTNQANAVLVQRKLCERHNSRTDQQAGAHSQNSSICAGHCMYEIPQLQAGVTQIPNGLVGGPCEDEAWMDGVHCPCLMDSGSQVTMVSQSFYSQHLSHRPLYTIGNVLNIEGAAGQKVPYLGYIEIELQFPQHACGTDKCISALVLVSPDQSYNEKIPLLVGTNVLRVLVQDCIKKGGTQFLKTLPIQANWSIAYSEYCKNAKPQTESVRVLRVTLGGKIAVRLKQGETGVLKGICHTKPKGAQFQGLVSGAEGFPTPGGLIVHDQIVDVKPESHNRFKLAVKNLSQHDIILHPKTVIAECSPIDWAIPVASSALNASPDAETLHAHALLVSTAEEALHTFQTPELDFGDSPISSQLKEHLQSRVDNEVPHAFSRHEHDIGGISGVTHRIELEPHVPFKERTRRVSPGDFNDLKRHLQDLVATGIIEESASPYASPIVLVRKKNGDLRMVIDYRRLNNLTKKDAYPLPRIEETFALLSGSKWFTVLDLKSGYYQLEMEPSDRPKTAFTTPFGIWQFRRMPQGLTNSPATFQRTMEKVMAGLNLQEVITFLDDLIVFSDSLEEHEERLMKVLKRIADFGLKLSPSKCKFFQTKVKYLGHEISAQGIQPDPDKVAAIREWPRPQTVRELRSFLGFTGYYRRFVRDYSRIVRPLNDLLKGEFAPRHKSQSHWKRTKSSSLSNIWTSNCQDAFELIIQKLTSTPVLGFADWRLPYVVHTDASTIGLGAVLYQIQEDQLRVVAYASRGLSRSERNYPAHKLEFLALKWAVSQKFNDYLYGATFKVLTDNNPLTYVLTSAKLDATSHRWLAALSIYNFDIHYKSGKLNADADGLSRRPQEPPQEDEESVELDRKISSLMDCARLSPEEFNVLDGEAVGTLCMRHGIKVLAISGESAEDEYEIPAIETLLCSEGAVPDDLEEPLPWPGQPTLPGMSTEDWQQLQREDGDLARVKDILTRDLDSDTIDKRREQPEVMLLLRERSKLILIDGVLYRKVLNQRGEAFHQLVVPSSLRERAFQGIHDETGHMGIERTLELARARFYWPKLAQYIERKCKSCERCVRRKSRVQKAAKLVNIKVSAPLELVCIDFLSLEPDSRDTRNILVITDHFTKYAQAYPTRDQTAKTVATVLWENFICHYGFPRRIHSDQGACFESELVTELCNLSGIKSRTTPYHPRGNPVERFNRTLLDLLGTLEDKKKEEWRKYVRPLVHAYNCTRNDSTGEAPFLLMFGREPRLPIDLCFGISPQGHNPTTHSHYVRELKRRLRYAYQLASKNAERLQLRNKRRWDAKVTALPLEVGDRVLVRNLNLRKKHKISDRWESAVHIVIKQPDENIPVYVVKPEDGEGRERVLHRDMLLPCGFLPTNLEVRSEDAVSVPSQVSRTTDEEQEVQESPFIMDVEIGETGALSVAREQEDWAADYMPPQAPESEILGTLSESQLESSLNPDAQEFSSDHSGLSEPENSPPPIQGRPQRRQVPPAYLSDYQLDSKFTCSQHSVSSPAYQTLLCTFLMSMQAQIAVLLHSMTDGDVRF